jgi:hypothetical protein
MRQKSSAWRSLEVQGIKTATRCTAALAHRTRRRTSRNQRTGYFRFDDEATGTLKTQPLKGLGGGVRGIASLLTFICIYAFAHDVTARS